MRYNPGTYSFVRVHRTIGLRRTTNGILVVFYVCCCLPLCACGTTGDKGSTLLDSYRLAEPDINSQEHLARHAFRGASSPRGHLDDDEPVFRLEHDVCAVP